METWETVDERSDEAAVDLERVERVRLGSVVTERESW